jgi:hypothetical protein
VAASKSSRKKSFSAHVRWCEHGAPLQSCGDRDRLEGESCGIPHVAKNEGWSSKALAGGLVDELEADEQEPKGERETELTVGDAGGYSAACDRSEDATYSQLPE